MEDAGGNTQTELLTIIIQPFNDNAPTLLLDGDNDRRNYETTFYEGQAYLGGATPVRLSANLRITDEDVGDQVLSSASITISDSE